MQITQPTFFSLPQIQTKICDIIAEQCGVHRADVSPDSRIIEDLHCDSLALVELIMTIEDEFDVALPDHPPHSAYKQVFTRSPFRLRDLAELVYLQQGSGHIPQKSWWRHQAPLPARTIVPFLQLDGRATPADYFTGPLYTAIGMNAQGFDTFRRCTDGMPCVLIPAAQVTLGSSQGDRDEQPPHRVQMDPFLIDQEPVSTSAYCRFLNSIGEVDLTILQEWFLLPANDKRREHQLICCESGTWSPLPDSERFPMILVSWYGAAAYARWANRRNWMVTSANANEMDECLPSEAQWEYAARGAEERAYPWGDAPANSARMRYACHQGKATYKPETLPLAKVNERLGVSPFGLTHMAGNVWQWCRDWYATDSYESEGPIESNVKSERGGSWIGPDFLCRSSYRRGRAPMAKGRCLGFRCVAEKQRSKAITSSRPASAKPLPVPTVPPAGGGL